MKSHASINRIYRLVWSPVSSCCVAVAENARGQPMRRMHRCLPVPPVLRR
jgi:hypothetical protein